MRLFYPLVHRAGSGNPLLTRTSHPEQETPGYPQAAAAKFRLRLQTRPAILVLLLACSLLLLLGLQLSAPYLARSLADNLPTNWLHTSSERVLARLDAGPLQASRAPPELQARLRERFAALSAPAEGAPPYRLLFRHSTQASPLLFSLPSGDIVVSDRLFATVPDPAQQLALLCQELGHLQYQHALHEAVTHNLLWLAFAALSGSAERSIDALSAGLLRSHYSLAQLQAADRYAQNMLRSNAYPPELLARGLERHAGSTAPGEFSQPAKHPSHTEKRLHALRTQS